MSIADDDLSKDIRAKIEAGESNLSAIARDLGATRAAVSRRAKLLGIVGKGNSKKEEKEVTLPEFPESDIPVSELIDHMCRRFDKRKEFKKSKKWYPVKINIDGPIGLSFIGDPHVDDDGCDWPALTRHCEIFRKTKALYAVNIGDTVNNWIGRLSRLWANQEASAETGRKLAKWLLTESGINWLLVLLGNHDLWGDFSHWLKEASVQKVPMEDWQAQFVLSFPNGRECRVWAAHDFPGHSDWNSLHGPQKAAHKREAAHIYACGHKHNWAIHQEESGSRDFIYWLIRSRGYKYLDHYSELLGHFPQEEGASVTCIIDPKAKSEAGLVQAFADLEQAAEYLNYLRRRK